MADEQRQIPRAFKLSLLNCLSATCDGKLAELSYYERNNWVTAEYRCEKCGKEFTVKVEA